MWRATLGCALLFPVLLPQLVAADETGPFVARIRVGCGENAIIKGPEQLSISKADCPLNVLPKSVLQVRRNAGPIMYVHLKTSNLELAEALTEVTFERDCYTVKTADRSQKICKPDPSKVVAANGKWFNVPEASLRRASQDLREPRRWESLLSEISRLEAEPVRVSETIGAYEELSRELANSEFIQRRIAWLKDLRDTAPSPSRQSQSFGVSVGISDYAWLPEEWQLHNAAADAELFRNYLVNPLGARLEAANTVLLTDERATSAAIRHETEEVLLRKARSGDTVYLFVSGHGLAERENWSSFLVAHDSLPSEPKTLYPMADLLAAVRTATGQGVRVLLFADMCHAGALANNWIHNGPGELGSLEGRFVALMASQGDQFSWEIQDLVAPGHGHGVFTHELVRRGLAGQADTLGPEGAGPDGRVRLSEILAFLEREVPKTAREKLGRRQVPQVLGGLSEDIVLSGPWGGTSESELQRNFDPESHEALRVGSARLLVDEIRKLVQDLMARRKVPYSSEWRRERDRLVARLEEQGQEVLLRYITGDELAPTREDFLLCAESFEQASTLNPWAAELEVRANFCKGRARLFDIETVSDSATQRQILQESVQVFQKALDLDPAAGYIYNAIGVAYLENGMFEEAARYFNDAILLNPHWAYAHHNLALTRIEQGRYGEAENQYRRGVETAAYYGLDYGYLRHSLGLLYQRLGRSFEAETEYRRASRLFRQKHDGFAALSSRLPEGPRSAWAQARARDLRQHEAKTWNALGTLLEASGRRKHADDHYRQALQLDPALASARHNLGLWLQSRGETETAIAEWRENEQRNPGFTPTIRSLALAYGNQAETSLGAAAENAYRLALPYYQQLTRLDPTYLDGQLGLARVLLALALDRDTALTAAEKAVELQPRNPETLKTLGDLLWRAGRAEEAALRYNEALQYATERRLKREITEALRQAKQ